MGGGFTECAFDTGKLVERETLKTFVFSLKECGIIPSQSGLGWRPLKMSAFVWERGMMKVLGKDPKAMIMHCRLHWQRSTRLALKLELVVWTHVVLTIMRLLWWTG